MNAKEYLKFFCSFVLCVIGFFIVSFMLFGTDMNEVEKNYKQNGVRTQAVITFSFGNKSYYGVYTDSKGRLIEAEIIPNKSVIIGDVVEGYYLPEKPNKVWCEPSLTLIYVLKGLLWFIEILLGSTVVLFIWAFVFRRNNETDI